MFRIRSYWFLAALLAPLAPAAHAADSYDSCTGFITTLPTVIAAQGVWCMNSDLATSIASGAAITVATNNVTIDCNHFKLGGLSAGLGTTTYGVSSDRLNTVVRNCNVRGFFRGVNSSGGSLLVEDNRFESSTVFGILAAGDSAIVRRNEIVDTGGSTFLPYAIGILAKGANAQLIDNNVDGVVGEEQLYPAAGIIMDHAYNGLARGNRINSVLATDGQGAAIYVELSTSVLLEGNAGFGAQQIVDGVVCQTVNGVVMRNNTMLHFSTGFDVDDCIDAGGNVTEL